MARAPLTGQHALASLCASWQTRMIQELRGFNEKKLTGLTALMLAAVKGDEAAARLALDAPDGAMTISVDDRDYEGRSALHVAAARGKLNLVQLLINEYHASPSLVDELGQTPLHGAVHSPSARAAPGATASPQ